MSCASLRSGAGPRGHVSSLGRPGSDGAAPSLKAGPAQRDLAIGPFGPPFCRASRATHSTVLTRLALLRGPCDGQDRRPQRRGGAGPERSGERGFSGAFLSTILQKNLLAGPFGYFHPKLKSDLAPCVGSRPSKHAQPVGHTGAIGYWLWFQGRKGIKMFRRLIRRSKKTSRF